MISIISELNEFAKQQGKGSVVELPVRVQKHNYLSILEERYKGYTLLLEEFLSSKGRKAIWENVKDDLKLMCDSFIKVIKDNFYESLSQCFDKIEKKWSLIDLIGTTLEERDYYRFCSYSTNLTQPKDFYHCPFGKEGINTRFGTSEIPLWYLGCSKEVCKCEAEGKTGSLAVFRQKKDTEPIKIIDLTQKKYYDINENSGLGFCYVFWWLLACCYCFLETDNHKETSVVPQMFAKYIRDNYKDISGIKYYTVRNSLLNPEEETFVNVALFTRKYDAEGYDMNLCGKFEMLDCKQNVKMA